MPRNPGHVVIDARAGSLELQSPQASAARKVIAMLQLLAFAVPRDIAGGHQQLKAHLAGALVALREFVAGLERSFVRQAVLRMHHLIDPRCRDHLPRLVKFPAGIGIHALDRVAWGT